MQYTVSRVRAAEGPWQRALPAGCHLAIVDATAACELAPALPPRGPMHVSRSHCPVPACQPPAAAAGNCHRRTSRRTYAVAAVGNLQSSHGYWSGGAGGPHADHPRPARAVNFHACHQRAPELLPWLAEALEVRASLPPALDLRHM